MARLSLALLLFACSCLRTTAQAQMKNDASDSEQSIPGCLSGERTKRGLISKGFTFGAAMIKGQRARQKLLKGLTPVKQAKFVTFYKKNGGVTEMIADFDAVNPTNVQPFNLNGMTVGKEGRVGDRTISYSTGESGRRMIFLIKTKQNGGSIVDIVAYH